MITLLYDGTFEGLLTCIYDGFYYKTTISGIYNKKLNDIPLLLENIIDVNTDLIKFSKVKSSIINKINKLCLKKIYIAYLSNYTNKEILIFNYLKTAFKIGSNIHSFLHIDEVRLIDQINKRVNDEIHRFRGFIRFNYIDNIFLYASIEPDNDILEFLGDYFKNRFSNEYWIINDISRKKAIIYNKTQYEIIDFTLEASNKLSSYKDEYQKLWKTYFKSTTIEERKNLRLQTRMMPKRYWKHIFETK